MKYTMTQPCSLCPFRDDDKRLTVSVERLQEFAYNEFPCHQTAEYQEAQNEHSGDGGYVGTADSQHCAGSLIFHEHLEQPHQMMRIAERLGMYDRTKLNMDAPVFQSWQEVEDATADHWR